ncbi:EAL domain-containing protein [Candidatus Liberibacter brunswickensis]|uniref:EAL domain-containing protein n=1 Tax=Candidatus Liberibacter brunswickensis TaxID=1968796 RepID=UPI0038CC0A31
MIFFFLMVSKSFAIEAVQISSEDSVLDLTPVTKIYANQREDFQLFTAADIDGISKRIEISASSVNHRGDWAVFALANTSDIQLERLVVVPHYRLVGSHFFWPDLGSRRIISITPSEGFSLDRIPNSDSDVFRITINPRAIVTFIMEISTPNLPKIYLWKPNYYKDAVNSFTLYQGIIIGIAGLLSVFLTTFYMVNKSSILIPTFAMAWIVFGYICIDFGFLSKLIGLQSGELIIWRACSEVALSFSIFFFLFIYLNLSRWYSKVRYINFFAILCLAVLFFISFYYPTISAGIARFSFAIIFLFYTFCIVYLGIRGYNRAISLIPAWIIIFMWSIGSWMAITNRVDNDIIQPALVGCLVLIVILIGFTVIQHVLVRGNFSQGIFSDVEHQFLAVLGSGDIVWDWNVVSDKVITKPDIAVLLGLSSGSMHGVIRNWLPHIHIDDRDNFRTIMDSFVDYRRGKLKHEFRVRAADNQFHWMSLRIRPILNPNGDILRCIGIINDITEQRNFLEGILYNACKDNLTGIPNRLSFIDSLTTILNLSVEYDRLRPTVMVIDIDRYKHINDSFGIAIGDDILVSLTKRMRELLKSSDIIARFSGNRFGIIIMSENDSIRIEDFAIAIKKFISNPIHILNREIMVTASIGFTSWTSSKISSCEMIKNAELAMYHAKQRGGNRIESFQDSLKSFRSDKLTIKEDLCFAIENYELYLVYQPIIRTVDEEIVGLEAIVQWDHPKLGSIPPSEFISVAEEIGMIKSINLFMLERIATDILSWCDQATMPPIFMLINVVSKDLLDDELCEDIQALISKTLCSPSSIKLSFSESIVMDNPERSSFLFEKLKKIGLSLTLDEFGTKCSLLSYLIHIPFDTIKLNGTLITGSTAKRIAMLRSLMSSAKNLDTIIITKDIYGEIDIKDLAKMGCDYIQGDRIAAPLRFNPILKLLKDRLPLVKNN